MNIRLCLTTMNRPAELVKAVGAALASDIPVRVTVIDNSTEHYAGNVLPYDTRLDIITLPHNAGLGAAINLAFALYDDYLIVGNDDIEVQPHTLRALVEAAEYQPEYSLFFGNCEADPDLSGGFSLFLLRKQAFLEVGGFDPAIWPIYYDDIDILRRLALLGHAPVTVRGAAYSHLKNATINAFDWKRRELHDRQFARNEAYYRAKWGGLKFEETFSQPFNGGRPRVPPLIKE